MFARGLQARRHRKQNHQTAAEGWPGGLRGHAPESEATIRQNRLRHRMKVRRLKLQHGGSQDAI